MRHGLSDGQTRVGHEAVDQVGPVLDPFQPVFDGCLEMLDVVDGEVADAAFQV